MLVFSDINYESKILNILVKKSVVSDVTLTSKIKDDLRIDPMDFFDIVLEIEKLFCIELHDDDIYVITTVEDLLRCVKLKM